MARTDFSSWVLGCASTALALSSGACDWKRFDELKEQASVRTYDAPGSYRRSGYGSVIATFHGEVGGRDVARMMASAGADSPIVVERMWNGKGLDSGTTVRCRDSDDCKKGIGAGAALIPFPTWAKGTLDEHHGCVYAPGDPNAYVFCETNPGSNPTFKLGLDKPEGATLLFSGAALPSEHPLGIVLVGAYAEALRTKEPLGGSLYAQPDLSSKTAPPLRELSVRDPRTGKPFNGEDAAADFGFAVAVSPNAAGELVIAISQPSQNRVIVATFDQTIADDPSITDPAEQLSAKLQTRACLKAEDPALSGVGKRLLLGDVNGDGDPEIFVGIDPLDGKNAKKQRLWMYRGADMPAYDPAADVCPLWGQAPVQVGCIDGIRGVDCEDTGFGASLAVGDVDGDQLQDLLVGAPLADVQGVKEAGVVWVIPGSEDHEETGGLDFDGMTNLYATSFEDEGHVGMAVGAVRTKDRDEPVAGAPGSDTIYMFMCSKLETGLSTKQLCLPK